MKDIEAVRQSQATHSDHKNEVGGDSKANNNKVGTSNSEIDSGIDTSDSCDEKKPKAGKSESAQKKKQHSRVAQ